MRVITAVCIVGCAGLWLVGAVRAQEATPGQGAEGFSYAAVMARIEGTEDLSIRILHLRMVSRQVEAQLHPDRREAADGETGQVLFQPDAFIRYLQLTAPIYARWNEVGPIEARRAIIASPDGVAMGTLYANVLPMLAADPGLDAVRALDAAGLRALLIARLPWYGLSGDEILRREAEIAALERLAARRALVDRGLNPVYFDLHAALGDGPFEPAQFRSVPPVLDAALQELEAQVDRAALDSPIWEYLFADKAFMDFILQVKRFRDFLHAEAAGLPEDTAATIHAAIDPLYERSIGLVARRAARLDGAAPAPVVAPSPPQPRAEAEFFGVE